MAKFCSLRTKGARRVPPLLVFFISPPEAVAAVTGDALTAIPTRMTVKTRHDALRGSRETNPLHPVDASPVVKLEAEVVEEDNWSVGLERKMRGSAGAKHESG